MDTVYYPNGAINAFAYNGLDARVSRTDSGGTRTFKRDGAGVTDAVLSDGVSAYTPGVSTRTSGATKFNLADRLGTFGIETSASQAITATKQYDAFGNLTSSSGSSASVFGFAGGWGYQEDPDSGLKLLGHRYYDPSTGRFLTRDPAKDGRNWYGYCENNPLTCVDPTGYILNDKPQDLYAHLEKGDVLVPPSPPGENLRKDLHEIDSLPELMVWIVLGWRYRPGGKWDWKPEYREWGNFHYGAMMAMLGMSLDEAFYWVGVAEWYDGDARDPSNSPWNGYPYGESYETLYWVRMGWWYYHHYIDPYKRPKIGKPTLPAKRI